MPEHAITINGRKLAFTPDETILEIARRNGIFIPTLCYLRGTAPSGACRVCLVEIEGARALAPACSMPASDNMVIRTDSNEVLEARRTVIALLLQSGNHNCAVGEKNPGEWTQFQKRAEKYDESSELCPAHSACTLQALAYRYQVDTSGLVRIAPKYPPEMASPLIIRDFSRCILCGRCVEACNSIQVNNAISHGFRGARAKIVAMGDDPLFRSDCVFCGECIQACPVAALVETKSRYRIRPWEARHVRTTCYYCAVGCQLNLHIKDETIMKVTGVEDARPNLGSLCIKGRFGYDFLNSPDRLKRPMLREGSTLRQTSWEEALDLVANKINEAVKTGGPESVAGICSAKSTNESIYLMQKLFRTAIGTNNLSCAGAGSGMNSSLEELERASNMILINSDVTEESPVAGAFIKRAVKNGCRLIVVDYGPTRIGSFAEVSLQLKENTESVLVNGIINQLLSRGRTCTEEVSEVASHYPIDFVTETTGLDRKEILAAVEILDTDDPIVLGYGPRAGGSVEAFVRLQQLMGNLGTASGGVNFLGQMNNSQGACDMGMLPGFLPGYVPVGDRDARKAFEAFWDCRLNEKPGLGFNDIFESICNPAVNLSGPVRMLYCAGHNLALAASADKRIAAGLDSIDFLVMQDILDSETLEHADVVLPTAAWAEEEGTYTNCERRVNRVRQAVPSPGEAKPETWIFTQLARRLGQNWPMKTSRELWETEVALLVPRFSGLTYDRLREEGVKWNGDREGTSPQGFSAEMGPVLIPPQTFTNTYDHHVLLEHCHGLVESLPSSSGIGIHVPPSNRQEVRENFRRFLVEEEKTDIRDNLDEILARYRDVKGGLIPVLQQAQELIGFLPVPVQNYVALGLKKPPSEVMGVVTFYSFFTMVPRGRHTIRLCLGTACFVKGSGKLLGSLQRHLHIGIGETTEDREFSLDVVRCLGACGLAPVMVVDDVTHGEVDGSKIVDIVEGFRGMPAQDSA